MRAMGIGDRPGYCQSVSADPETIKYMLENLEESEASNKIEAMEKIGLRVAQAKVRITR